MKQEKLSFVVKSLLKIDIRRISDAIWSRHSEPVIRSANYSGLDSVWFVSVCMNQLLVTSGNLNITCYWSTLIS